MDLIKIDDIRLDIPSINQREKRKPSPQRPKYKWFIRGPVDFMWLSKAAALPGKAFLVGVAVWFVDGMKKSNTIKIQGWVLADLHISRKAFNRGLNRLAEIGLIKVNRRPGRIPEITLLPAPKDGQEQQNSPENKYWRKGGRSGSKVQGTRPDEE